MRIAVCQARASLGDKAKNLEAVQTAARAAAAWHTDLLVLPEMFLTGYKVGGRVRELAEPVNGPWLDAVSDIARSAACAIIVGFPERDGNEIFNSSALIDDQGKLVTVYRKIHLFGPAEKALFSAGSELAVARLKNRTIGMAICYDIEFPEVARGLKKLGAEIIVAPTANMAPYFEVPQTFVRARALENGVYVVYANLCGSDDELLYTGLSGITGPDGLDIARAGQRGEALLIAELTFDYPAASLSTQAEDLRLP